MSARPKRPAKLAVWERDNWTCFYCGDPVTVSESNPPSKKSATVDHVVPRSQGGRNAQVNLVTACYECNHAKRDSSPFHPHNRDYTGEDRALALALERAFQDAAT